MRNFVAPPRYEVLASPDQSYLTVTLYSGTIVNVNVPVALPLELLAVRVMWNTPEVAGVPEISPVEVKVKPEGSGAAPKVMLPLRSVIIWKPGLYGTFTVRVSAQVVLQFVIEAASTVDAASKINMMLAPLNSRFLSNE